MENIYGVLVARRFVTKCEDQNVLITDLCMRVYVWYWFTIFKIVSGNS